MARRRGWPSRHWVGSDVGGCSGSNSLLDVSQVFNERFSSEAAQEAIGPAALGSTDPDESMAMATAAGDVGRRRGIPWKVLQRVVFGARWRIDGGAWEVGVQAAEGEGGTGVSTAAVGRHWHERGERDGRKKVGVGAAVFCVRVRVRLLIYSF